MTFVMSVTSPPMEHPLERRRGHRHHKGHREHPHRSRRAMSRQPERSSYDYHQPLIPRSHSYSGQAGLQESLAQMGQPQLTRHQSPHVGRRPPAPAAASQANYQYSNYHLHHGFLPENEEDLCSTCSSSSSDSDDPYAYQLPPRRAYGGVRISYVPNDRFALSHHHQARHLASSGRRSLRHYTPGPEVLSACAQSPAPPGPGAQVRGHHLAHPGPDMGHHQLR